MDPNSKEGKSVNRGYAFISFEEDEATQKCMADLGKTGLVNVFAKRDERDISQKLGNSLYFKNVPDSMSEEDIKKMFEPYGKISYFSLKQGEIGRFGIVCFGAE